ncbi:NADPH-dependent F420 reductase [Streptomyces sp. NPDC008238]
MRIGFIGAGAIAQAAAIAFLRGGHEVVFSNTRGPASLAPLVAHFGPRSSAGTVAEAARHDVVVLSVPWRSVPDAVAGLGPWDDRIVIDTNNPLQAPDFVPANLNGRTSSEVVQDLLPGARVVKTLNSWSPALLAADPHREGGRRVQFVSGDAPEARAVVSRLLESAGFAVIDLGGLSTGGALQQFPGGPLPALDLVRF